MHNHNDKACSLVDPKSSNVNTEITCVDCVCKYGALVVFVRLSANKC